MINVEKIMNEIYEQIEKDGLKDDLPSFEETTEVKHKVNDLQGMHITWNIPVSYPINDTGIKKIIKKLVAKCVNFYLKMYVTDISSFNGFTTRTVNDLYVKVDEQQRYIEELEGRISKLEGK